MTHERERTSEDLFHRAYVSAWLLRLLKVTSYFPENVKTPDTIDQPLSKGELLVAGAILHHIQLLQFNSHEVDNHYILCVSNVSHWIIINIITDK